LTQKGTKKVKVFGGKYQ